MRRFIDEPMFFRYLLIQFMQPYYHIIGAFLVSVALGVGAQTTNQPGRSLALDDCLQIALEHNLDVQIQRLDPVLARYNLSLAYAGYDPNLSIGGQHDFSLSPGGFSAAINQIYQGATSDDDAFNAGISGLLPIGLNYNLSGNVAETYGSRPDQFGVARPFQNAGGRAQITLTQPLLKNFWIDQTRMNIWVSRKSIKTSELNLRLQIMNTVSSVEQAYYNLIAALETVKVNQMAVELAERTLMENKKKVEVGTMAPLDEKQAESQVYLNRANLLSARRALSAQQNLLKKLLSDNYSGWQEVNLQPAENLAAPAQLFNLQDSWQKGLAMRPELISAKNEVEKQDIVLRYNRNQLFPELDLIGTYGHAAGGSGETYASAFDQMRQGSSPFYTYGARLTMPLTRIGPRYNYKANKAQKQRLVLQLKQLEQNIMVQIDDAVRLAQTSFERVEATKQGRIYSEAALDAEQKKYESGKSTSFFVLQFQQTLTNARSQEIQALADYNNSLSQLALAEGSTLDRSHLNVQVK